ncbi:MAG TPA: hypothetical protein VJZ49_12170 [Syntrophales bacterium]|nr:hypothetical protein [Syntrophales bacterium]
MSRISYVLLSDGSSDKMLMPILDWLLHRQCPNYAIDPKWADLRRLPHPPRELIEKIRMTLELYEPDLLFIHRDAENQPFESRRKEITGALAGKTSPPAVCVIPVRMQEAWLLIDEKAIRKAAGNPNGRMPLRLPAIDTVESLPDPKELLFSLIREASGLSGTRLKKQKPEKHAHLVSQFIDDFELLQTLSAFRALEVELTTVIQIKGWHNQ